MKQPKERIRSLSADEEARLFAVLPPAYAPIVRFALRTGCRVMECINLRWSDIDWGNRRIAILGKGDKLASVPLSIDMRDMPFPMRTDGEAHVFMMAAPIRKDGFVEPRRRITYRAFYSAFLVAKTGNLKRAMKLLRHEDISTTAKYAAVLDDDLRRAMDRMGEAADLPSRGAHTKVSD